MARGGTSPLQDGEKIAEGAKARRAIVRGNHLGRHGSRGIYLSQTVAPWNIFGKRSCNAASIDGSSIRSRGRVDPTRGAGRIESTPIEN